MTPPSPESVAFYAIREILTAMIKAEDTPMSAETHLASAVVMLNQLALINGFGSKELDDQLKYCREIILRKHLL